MAPIKIGRRAVVIALLVELAAPISGNPDEIDHYITAQMQRLHIPGVSLAIVRDGRVTKVRSPLYCNPH
jgi:CubicO group peptidase (beta-lactamase class C family)